MLPCASSKNRLSVMVTIHQNGVRISVCRSASDPAIDELTHRGAVVYDEVHHVFQRPLLDRPMSLSELGLQPQPRRILGLLLAYCDRVLNATRASSIFNNDLSDQAWKNARRSIVRSIDLPSLGLTLETVRGIPGGPNYVMRRGDVTVISILVFGNS